LCGKTEKGWGRGRPFGGKTGGGVERGKNGVGEGEGGKSLISGEKRLLPQLGGGGKKEELLPEKGEMSFF